MKHLFTSLQGLWNFHSTLWNLGLNKRCWYKIWPAISKSRKNLALRLGNNFVTLSFNQITVEMDSICSCGLAIGPGFDSDVFSSLKTTSNFCNLYPSKISNVKLLSCADSSNTMMWHYLASTCYSKFPVFALEWAPACKYQQNLPEVQVFMRLPEVGNFTWFWVSLGKLCSSYNYF